MDETRKGKIVTTSLLIGSCYDASCCLESRALFNAKSFHSLQVKTSITTFPSSAEIVSEPLGVVLIIGAWNFPLCMLRTWCTNCLYLFLLNSVIILFNPSLQKRGS